MTIQKHELDAELLLYLCEIDRRRLYREHACSSAFEFCVTRLACSEEVAWKRVGAARLLLQFPIIYELLANGRIHLTGLMLLKPHLTEVNHEEWLGAACGKSKRQIEKLIATRAPRPDTPTSARKLPEAKAPSEVASNSSSSADQSDMVSAQPSEASRVAESLDVPRSEPASLLAPLQASAAQTVDIASPNAVQLGTAPSSMGQFNAAQAMTPNAAQSGAAQSGAAQSGAAPVGIPSTSQPDVVPSQGSRAAVPAQIAPLSSHSYRVVFTASERLKQKLDRARELLSHAIAPNDLPAVIERALDQLIKREEQRRYGLHTKPKSSNQSVGAGVAVVAAVEQSVTTLGKSSVGASSKRGDSKPVDPKPVDSKREELRSKELERETVGNRVSRGEVQEREPTERALQEREPTEREVQESCQESSQRPTAAQDPDPTAGIKAKQPSRYVRAAVRREVFMRDGGQCTFVDQVGRRCEQRHFLEFDHRVAYAIGGSGTAENLTIRCRAHNSLEAEKLFGQRQIASAIAHARGKRAR